MTKRRMEVNGNRLQEKYGQSSYPRDKTHHLIHATGLDIGQLPIACVFLFLIHLEPLAPLTQHNLGFSNPHK